MSSIDRRWRSLSLLVVAAAVALPAAAAFSEDRAPETRSRRAADGIRGTAPPRPRRGHLAGRLHGRSVAGGRYGAMTAG